MKKPSRVQALEETISLLASQREVLRDRWNNCKCDESESSCAHRERLARVEDWGFRVAYQLSAERQRKARRGGAA